jgi:hypothetical protein
MLAQQSYIRGYPYAMTPVVFRDTNLMSTTNFANALIRLAAPIVSDKNSYQPIEHIFISSEQYSTFNN